MNVKRLSKRTLAMLLSVLLLLSTFVVGTATTASADSADTWDIQSGSYIMFDNTNTNWTLSRSYALFVTSSVSNPKVLACSLTTSGSGSFSKVTAFSKGYYLASDTLIKKFSGYTWNNIKYVTFVTTNTGSTLSTGVFEKSDLFDGNDLSADAKTTYKISEYTNNYTDIINDNTKYKYYFIPSAKSDGVYPISMVKLDGDKGACVTQTINFADSSGNTISASNFGVSVDISSYTTSTGLGVVTSTAAASSGVQSETTINPLYDTSVTLKANENSGVANFVGWYDSNNNPFPDSTSYTDASITFSAKKIDTITARFSATSYTQTVTAGTGGTATVSDGTNSGSKISVSSGTDVTFTAASDAFYMFDGWYDSEDAEEPVSTDNPYTVTAASDNTLYARFTLSGDAGTFNFKADKNSTSRIFFARPSDSAWTDAPGKVFILLYTDSTVYSVELPQVKNSLLNTASAYTIMNNAQSINENLKWSDITDIAFIELENNNKTPKTYFSNKDLINGYKYLDKNNDNAEVKFEGITTAPLDSETAEKNGIACYTGKYSATVADNGVRYHYFKPADSSKGAAVDLNTQSTALNYSQKVIVPEYGGTVNIKSYISSSSGASVNAQDVPYAYYFKNEDDSKYSSDFNAAYTSTVTLTPVVNNSSYSFAGWYSDSGYTNKITSGVDEKTNAYTYIVNSDNDIYAKFEYASGTAPQNFKQDVNTVDGGGVAAKFDNVTRPLPYYGDTDTKVTLTAYPNSGYKFDGFYNGDAFVSSDNPYTYTVTAETTLTPKFSEKSDSEKLLDQKAVVVDGTGGTATVSDGTTTGSSLSVTSGTEITFKAVKESASYEFYGWYANEDCSGMPASTEETFKVTATTANTLYAKFILKEGVDSDSDSSTKNNKSRDIHATTLSKQAISYYTSDVSDVDKYKTADSDTSGVYETFVKLAGLETNDSSDSFDVIYKNSDGDYDKDDSDDKYKYTINNSLYGALYDIMSSTHTHAVSYPAYGNNSLANYWLTTDTSSINSDDGRGVYTLFYSDEKCYNHKDMQREHIWPKSKASFLMKTGLGGSDLHHLRPAYGKLNLLKLNWGFASIKDGTGWKNTKKLEWPAGTTSLWRAEDEKGTNTTFIDVKDDVRGDVARILLYIYTRWREPNLYSDIVDEDKNPDKDKLPELDPDDSKDTGERIIYDLPTLLDWMEKDPVSEWEMKRNDLTQNIQGNRNVFIDYPELAWLIFDEDVPENMDTPSRAANTARTEYYKDSNAAQYGDKITLDFGLLDTGNGAAEITAYNNNTGKFVQNGGAVDRGDNITYTIIPDESKLDQIIQFSSEKNNTGSANRNTLAAPDSDSSYSFTKQAGYFDGKPNVSYKKERIGVKLTSNVCVLSYKVNSRTTTGNAGGSGSGMVVAQYAAAIDSHKKGDIIENGESVPNGAQVTLTFTPDFGSRYSGLTYGSAKTAENISGTSSYRYTDTLSCVNDGKLSNREKKFTVYFAQTFNANDKLGDEKLHINNKGMRPDEGDDWKEGTDFTSNFEICGVQIKKIEGEEDNKALRFVSVIDSDILSKAEDYGYVFGYTNQKLDTVSIDRLAYGLVKGGSNGYTKSCKDTDNTVFGKYGDHTTTTNYKYITAAIENIQGDGTVGTGTTIIARPYVVLKDKNVGKNSPKIIYGEYVDFSTGESYCACSGSYDDVYKLANAQ